ncbi:caspase family protein [Actinoplanes sp. NPDC051859]|uniref:caspase, EACC1-associated type n=1 Tax=Actinoplanes sp. NPDC051859 TaxID=3363909 RepID=UPI0037B311D1
MTHRHALILASEHYRHPAYSELPGTTADAEALREVLGDPRVGNFEITVLQDPDVRTAGHRIKRFFADAAPDDILLLYVAGHGVRNDEGNLYFAVSDTVPDLLWVTALAAKDITHEMETSPARRIVVLLDCCYAGAFDDRKDLDHAGPPPEVAAPPVGTAEAAGPSETLAASAPPADDAHVRGQVVIAAATSIQQAVEGKTGGLFTRCVVHGLRTGDADLNQDGAIDAHELHLYVDARMRILGAEVAQQPTYSVHRLQGMLRIAHRATAPSRAPVRTQPPARPPQPPEPPEPPEPPKQRNGLARIFLLLAMLLLSGCGVGADSPLTRIDCPTPTHLRVAAAPGGLGAYRELTAAFEDWVAGQRGGCRTVDLYVYPVTAQEMADGLARGWGQDPDGRSYLRDIGPHPDVWLPGAATDVPALGAPTPGFGATVQEVARTPIVLGVPRRAPVAAEARRATRTWPELFDQVSRATGVIRAEFSASAVARMATAKLYADGAIDPAVARSRYEQHIEQALDGGGYPVGDETTLLCRRAQRHDDTAVILTEQQLVRFNHGDAAGDACPQVAVPRAADQLQAYYPSDTPAVRQVVVTLTWPRQVQTGPTQAYARWFGRWLRTDPGRAALLGTGLRPYAYDAGEPLGPDNGALVDWPFSRVVQPEPDGFIRRDVAARYERARRPGQFLVALDSSGSMGTVTADPTRTRWEVAVAAVEQAVTRLGGRDRIGLLTFAGDGTRELLPLEAAGADPVAAVRRATAGVRPGGGTPLHEAVRKGAATLRASPGGSDPRRTLVVLTDGNDTGGQPRPTPAQTAGVRIAVIAVGDVTCADAGLRRLTADTAGRCYDAGLGSLEPILTTMFRTIWG